jgi:hypothetical protein
MKNRSAHNHHDAPVLSSTERAEFDRVLSDALLQTRLCQEMMRHAPFKSKTEAELCDDALRAVSGAVSHVESYSHQFRCVHGQFDADVLAAESKDAPDPDVSATFSAPRDLMWMAGSTPLCDGRTEWFVNMRLRLSLATQLLQELPRNLIGTKRSSSEMLSALGAASAYIEMLSQLGRGGEAREPASRDKSGVGSEAEGTESQAQETVVRRVRAMA